MFREKNMKHATQSDFGRGASFALSSVDKWEVLSALTTASADFDISHRTLTVLKALLTFLPDRDIPTEPGRAVVFPANRTLSERLNGMPESTLRRHLARLVQLGLVNRHDSPNRKRYARRVGQGVELAFGFDLSPLNGHADQIFLTAECATRRAERIRTLRDRIALARQQLIALNDSRFAALIENARLILRRKSSEQTLHKLTQEMEDTADQNTGNAIHQPELRTIQLSGPDNQNERHIQDSSESKFDSEEQTSDSQIPADKKNDDANLHIVLDICTEFQDYYPKPVTGWAELVTVAEKLSPMIGIDSPVFNEARVRMGAATAATSVLCILERLQDIRSPGAYLRKLTQKAQKGTFSCIPMLKALENKGKSENCQLTT